MEEVMQTKFNREVLNSAIFKHTVIYHGDVDILPCIEESIKDKMNIKPEQGDYKEVFRKLFGVEVEEYAKYLFTMVEVK